MNQGQMSPTCGLDKARCASSQLDQLKSASEWAATSQADSRRSTRKRPVLIGALLLSIFCSAYAPLSVRAQEGSLPPGAAEKQQHIPDSLLYGILFRHAAAFKDKADALDLAGQDGSPYRKHLVHKLQLTSEEEISLNAVALHYRLEVQQVNNDIADSIARFREANSHLVLAKGQPGPPPPPEAKSLLAKRDAITLSARDEFHGLIGDAEFRRLDGLIKTKFASGIHPVVGSLTGKPAPEAGEGK